MLLWAWVSSSRKESAFSGSLTCELRLLGDLYERKYCTVVEQDRRKRKIGSLGPTDQKFVTVT